MVSKHSLNNLRTELLTPGTLDNQFISGLATTLQVEEDQNEEGDLGFDYMKVRNLAPDDNGYAKLDFLFFEVLNLTVGVKSQEKWDKINDFAEDLSEYAQDPDFKIPKSTLESMVRYFQESIRNNQEINAETSDDKHTNTGLTATYLDTISNDLYKIDMFAGQSLWSDRNEFDNKEAIERKEKILNNCPELNPHFIDEYIERVKCITDIGIRIFGHAPSPKEHNDLLHIPMELITELEEEYLKLFREKRAFTNESLKNSDIPMKADDYQKAANILDMRIEFTNGQIEGKLYAVGVLQELAAAQGYDISTTGSKGKK